MKPTHAITAVIVALVGNITNVALAAAPSPANWPQFRGPGGLGVGTADAHPPVTFSPATNVAWRIDVPAGNSSPIVWGQRTDSERWRVSGLAHITCTSPVAGDGMLFTAS